MHTSAFYRVTEAVANSDLESFFAHSLPALWLIDSAVMIVLALLFAAISFRPAVATPLETGKAVPSRKDLHQQELADGSETP